MSKQHITVCKLLKEITQAEDTHKEIWRDWNQAYVPNSKIDEAIGTSRTILHALANVRARIEVLVGLTSPE